MRIAKGVPPLPLLQRELGERAYKKEACLNNLYNYLKIPNSLDKM